MEQVEEPTVGRSWAARRNRPKLLAPLGATHPIAISESLSAASAV